MSRTNLEDRIEESRRVLLQSSLASPSTSWMASLAARRRVELREMLWCAARHEGLTPFAFFLGRTDEILFHEDPRREVETLLPSKEEIAMIDRLFADADRCEDVVRDRLRMYAVGFWSGIAERRLLDVSASEFLSFWQEAYNQDLEITRGWVRREPMEYTLWWNDARAGDREAQRGLMESSVRQRIAFHVVTWEDAFSALDHLRGAVVSGGDPVSRLVETMSDIGTEDPSHAADLGEVREFASRNAGWIAEQLRHEETVRREIDAEIERRRGDDPWGEPPRS